MLRTMATTALQEVAQDVRPQERDELLAPVPVVTGGMLTEKQVRDRLRVNSPELVAELLTHVQGR